MKKNLITISIPWTFFDGLGNIALFYWVLFYGRFCYPNGFKKKWKHPVNVVSRSRAAGNLQHLHFKNQWTTGGPTQFFTALLQRTLRRWFSTRLIWTFPDQDLYLWLRLKKVNFANVLLVRVPLDWTLPYNLRLNYIFKRHLKFLPPKTFSNHKLQLRK